MKQVHTSLSRLQAEEKNVIWHGREKGEVSYYCRGCEVSQMGIGLHSVSGMVDIREKRNWSWEVQVMESFGQRWYSPEWWGRWLRPHNRRFCKDGDGLRSWRFAWTLRHVRQESRPTCSLCMQEPCKSIVPAKLKDLKPSPSVTKLLDSTDKNSQSISHRHQDVLLNWKSTWQLKNSS